MDLNRHIWEGWLVGDFIADLELIFDVINDNAKSFGTKPFENKEEVKKWCMDNQPYYKKHIPEVYNYFRIKAGL
jgi:hypothetical protein